MTFAPLSRAERTEWRQMLSPMESPRLLAALLMLLLSSLTLVFCQSTAVSTLFLLYAVIFYYSLTHSFMAVLILAAPGMLLMPISGYCFGLEYALSLPAAYAAVLLGGVGGALALMQMYRDKKQLLLFALLPIGAYLICFAVTGSPRHALLALIPVAIAVALAVCMLTCTSHTESVLIVAGVIALLAVVASLLAMLFFGNLSGNPLVFVAGAVRNAIIRIYTTAMQVSASEGMPLPFTDTALQNLAALVGNLLPGLFLLCCTLLAYAMWRMLLRIMLAWRVLPRMPLRLAALTVSPYAAAVFVVSYLASLVANGAQVTLFGMLCENLSLVLEPALALVGFGSLSPRRDGSCLSQMLAVGLLILFLFNLGLGLALAAFLGAFHILWSRFAPRDKGGK